MITIKARINDNKFNIQEEHKIIMEQFKKENEGKEIIMYLQSKDANDIDCQKYGDRRIVRIFTDKNNNRVEVRF